MDKKSTPNVASAAKKRKKISARYLENAGAYYLERFSASIVQFRKIMERKIDLSCRDHPEQEKDKLMPLLDDLVRKFETLGYLDDRRYTQSLISGLTQKGVSVTRMKLILRQKGTSSEMIDELMPERTQDDEQLAALRWAKKKRLGPFSNRHRENETKKSMASLARAGFDYSISSWVINLSREEADDILSTY
jgi:regulatory protein